MSRGKNKRSEEENTNDMYKAATSAHVEHRNENQREMMVHLVEAWAGEEENVVVVVVVDRRLIKKEKRSELKLRGFPFHHVLWCGVNECAFAISLLLFSFTLFVQKKPSVNRTNEKLSTARPRERESERVLRNRLSEREKKWMSDWMQ